MIGYQVRRANVDDLAQLIVLWQAVDLPVMQLEKRLTEFQVAEKDGQIAAAIGLHIQQHEGHLHSESFSDFALADALRPLLWERLERVAANHGLVRIWTQETAPFWRQIAFHPAEKEILAQRPKTFDNNEKLDWLVVQLKNVAAMPLNLDKEFERFKESERAKTDELVARGKMMKGCATVLAIFLVIFGFVVLFKYVFYKQRSSSATTIRR